MHGRRSYLVIAVLLMVIGCADGPQPPAPPALPESSAGAAFDPVKAGTVEGRVTWQGDLPAVPKLLVFPDSENPDPDGRRLYNTANPFCPLIDPASRGMQDVVVFLRTVEPQHAGAWPHGRVLVEQVQRLLSIVQDGVRSRVGFVRRGDVMEAVNRDAEYHSLRVRGAAFFALPFVEQDLVTAKRLDTAGVVELTSGAGYFWMCAHLLVVEHPYYARSDAAGRFRLPEVPAGRYELVCWMPTWVVRQKYRDPESALTSRLIFAPPVEQTITIEVRAGTTTTAQFAWTRDEAEGSRR